MLFHTYHVQAHQMGLLFVRGDFSRVLGPGFHYFPGPNWTDKLVLCDRRAPWLQHEKLDLIIRSGLLRDQVTVLDIKDHQRALVWMDERYAGMLGPGLHAAWNGLINLRTEVVEINEAAFEHKSVELILNHPTAREHLSILQVPQHYRGLLYRNSQLTGVLEPNRYAFWKAAGLPTLTSVDMRETVLDIAGQEIMTSDKVTLRMNAVLTYRITDPERAVSAVDHAGQALYREAQLVLRAAVGGRDLDNLLASKDTLGPEMSAQLTLRAEELGLTIASIGIRDIILPGEMKELLNRVIEAKKAAQANLIARQEETAAMRSQANTAKLLESNPTLMRLRELEVLERVAANGKLSVLLGDQGLRDRLTTMI